MIRKNSIIVRVEESAKLKEHEYVDCIRINQVTRKVIIKCKKCNVQWETEPNRYLKESNGCPCCTPKENINKFVNVDTSPELVTEAVKDLDSHFEDMKKIQKNSNGNFNPTWYKTINRNNIYFKFIESLRNKTFDKDDIIQCHHILPQYLFKKQGKEARDYMDSEENKIRLTVMDHVHAHELLYIVYRDKQDEAAAAMQRGQVDKAGRLATKVGQEESQKVQMALKLGFYGKEGLEKAQAARDTESMVRSGDIVDYYYKNIKVVQLTGFNRTRDVLEKLNEYYPTKLRKVSDLYKGRMQCGWTCKIIKRGEKKKP